MITVSPEFANAQNADVAKYVKQINLILGDYAAAGAGASASSNGDDGSGNFPASGAIDGDRTEINIGAASVADNGIGKSSWKSNANPSGGSPNILTIQFGQTRTFNRLKLYNLAANPSTSYVLEYSVDGSTGWTAFAGTADQFTPPTPPAGTYGWGTPGGWGMGPWGGSTSPYNVTGGLDTFDVIPDVTAKAIRIRIFATQTGGPGQVVAIEVYRKVDVSSRVLGFDIDRKKDFKLAQPISTQLRMDFTNQDQFFSLFYSPSASQAATYVNLELKTLGLNIEVNEGFVTPFGPQTIRTFTGSVDSIDNNAKPGRASIVARDFMKHLINQYDSCNLKTNIDIASAIQYLLNRNNVSSYEMSMATTSIILAYFFVYEQPILTSIQTLVQAAGDSIFYFDEQGLANFNYYLQATPQTGQTFSLTDQSNAWTLQVGGSGNTSAQNNGQIILTSQQSSGNEAAAQVASANATGQWTWSFSVSNSNGTGFFFFLADAFTPTSPFATHGYYVSLDATHVQLWKSNGTTNILIAQVLGTFSGTYQLRVDRNGSGVMHVYLNGALQITATENTYNTPGVLAFLSGGNNSFPNTVTAFDLYYDSSISNISGTVATFVIEAPAIDQTASVSVEGVFNPDYTSVAGASISFFTATSPDGVTWDPYVAATPGSQVASTVRRYIKWKVVITGSTAAQVNLRSVAIQWVTGTGQQKFSPNVYFNITTFKFLKDLNAQISDNLGGSTAIINDIAVSSTPLILGGTSSDTVWQAVAGTPPAAVSVSNPINVVVGTLVFNITIQGGIDVSNFGGVNTGSGGGGIALTFGGGATGQAQVTYSHPTKPTLTVTITNGGTITDLRLIGKTFQNASTPYQALAADAASIARHRRRHIDLANNFIVSQNVAGIIATKYITNFKAPVLWLPKVECTPPILNLQPGDTCRVIEALTGANQNFYIIGFSRSIRVDGGRASVSQSLALLPTS